MMCIKKYFLFLCLFFCVCFEKISIADIELTSSSNQKQQENINSQSYVNNNIENNKKNPFSFNIAPVFSYVSDSQFGIGGNLNVYYRFDKTFSVFVGFDGRINDIANTGKMKKIIHKKWEKNGDGELELVNTDRFYYAKTLYDVLLKVGAKFDVRKIFISPYTIIGAGYYQYNFDNKKWKRWNMKWGLGIEIGWNKLFVKFDWATHIYDPTWGDNNYIGSYSGWVHDLNFGVGYYLF